jgi:hypothetical protein
MSNKIKNIIISDIINKFNILIKNKNNEEENEEEEESEEEDSEEKEKDNKVYSEKDNKEYSEEDSEEDNDEDNDEDNNEDNDEDNDNEDNDNNEKDINQKDNNKKDNNEKDKEKDKEKDSKNSENLEGSYSSEDSDGSRSSEDSEISEGSEKKENNENNKNGDNKYKKNNFETNRLNYITSEISQKKYYNNLKNNTKKDVNCTDLENDIIINNYEGLLNKLKRGDNIYNISNNKNNKFHNYNDIDQLIKQIKTNIRKKEECYKNCLYYAIKNNIRGIKSIYNLLLKILNLKYIFRIKCKCCITESEKQYLEHLDKNWINIKMDETNASFMNEKFILEINFLINKFMSRISLLKCECSYRDKFYEFYNENYNNYYILLKIYNSTISKIVVGFKNLYKIRENLNELLLIKESRCIHKDIINYKNFYYCKKKIYKKFNNEREQIVDIIMNIDIINNWINTNNKIIKILYNEQSYNFMKYSIDLLDNKNLKINNKNILINDYFNIIYKNDFKIIDIEYESNGKNIINYIIEKDDINIYYEKQIIYLILTYKNIKNTNSKIILYILECFKKNKYELGIEFINSIDNLDKEEMNFNIELNNLDKKHIRFLLDKLLKNILDNFEININLKITYLKILYKKKINIIKYDIITKLIEIPDGDRLITIFDKSDNLLFTLNSFEDSNNIIKLIKTCIINKKTNLLDYILHNLNDNIKKINNQKSIEQISIINPYTIYFNTLNIINSINDIKNNTTTIFNEVEYISLLKIIIQYEYNINENYNYTLNNKNINTSYLEYSIIKNYNNSANILINNNINLFYVIIKDSGNVVDQTIKSLLFQCVDNNNHIIFGFILSKNYKIINIKYNKQTITNYLLKKINTSENILLKFLDKIITINIDINYQDEFNLSIPYEVLINNIISYENKIIFFNKLKDKIDPLLIYNKIPLIMFVMLMDYYDVVDILLNNLLLNKKILKMSSNNLLKDNKIINKYSEYSEYYMNTEKININFIPLIIKYIKEKEINILKLKSDSEFTIYYDEEKMIVLQLIILEIICLHIILNKQINHNNSPEVPLSNNFVNLHKNNINLDTESEKHKYQEITEKEYFNKNMILHTDSINNKDTLIDDKITNKNTKTEIMDIWNKNSQFESDETSISSEIEESNIIF